MMHALAIARRIHKDNPQDIEDLHLCFMPAIRSQLDFTPNDVSEFLPLALPYFLGFEEVPYVGEISGIARMKR